MVDRWMMRDDALLSQARDEIRVAVSMFEAAVMEGQSPAHLKQYIHHIERMCGEAQNHCVRLAHEVGAMGT